MADRDMQSKDGCRLLSKQSGHGWTCKWPTPVENDPNSDISRLAQTTTLNSYMAPSAVLD